MALQGLRNFIGGINDTMNFPAYAIGKVGAYFSPEGSRAKRNFQLFAQSARQASDMGQDYNSAGYALGRMAPALAAAPLAPVAAAPASVGTLSAIETAGLMAPALAGQEAFWVGLPSGEGARREDMRQQNLQRKQQIVNSLSNWKAQGVDFTNPRIKPLIQKIILEYNSL